MTEQKRRSMAEISGEEYDILRESAIRQISPIADKYNVDQLAEKVIDLIETSSATGSQIPAVQKINRVEKDPPVIYGPPKFMSRRRFMCTAVSGAICVAGFSMLVTAGSQPNIVGKDDEYAVLKVQIQKKEDELESTRRALNQQTSPDERKKIRNRLTEIQDEKNQLENLKRNKWNEIKNSNKLIFDEDTAAKLSFAGLMVSIGSAIYAVANTTGADIWFFEY